MRHIAAGLLVLASSAAVAPAAAEPRPLHGVVLVNGRPQKDVVVWLEGGAALPAPPTKIVLDQRQLQFKPHVLAVRTGTQVEMPNSDRVFHNVFSFHDGKRFDLGLYPVGTSKTVTFDRPGLSRIFCNIHPNMAAYVAGRGLRLLRGLRQPGPVRDGRRASGPTRIARGGPAARPRRAPSRSTRPARRDSLAMTRWFAALACVCLLVRPRRTARRSRPKCSQSVGVSTEDIAGAGTQVRVLGESGAGPAVPVEGAWGARSTEERVGRLRHRLSLRGQASRSSRRTASTSSRPGRGCAPCKGGRYRTPFGIYAASDHAYIGFLRPPLIRYGEYYALSSGYLEHGVDVVVGAPRLSVELSVGAPGDVGEAIRRPASTRSCAPKAGARLAHRRRQLHRHDAVHARAMREGPGALRRCGRAMDGRRRPGARRVAGRPAV